MTLFQSKSTALHFFDTFDFSGQCQVVVDEYNHYFSTLKEINEM